MKIQCLRRLAGLSLAIFFQWLTPLQLAADAESLPPVVESVFPEAGATHELRSIEVHFSESVTDVEAADLVVNGELASPSVA